ncbi:MAG: molybdopterin-dependent oxidoreductase [Anaerolineae bacterium]
MADKQFEVSRRGFLKGSTLGLAALALSNRALEPVWQGLTRLGVPTPWYKQAPIQTTYNYCDMCPWRCGIVVQSVNGRVVKIDGNPKDPKSRGMLCGRGQAGVSFTYDPDRLTQPMIRTGERGAGQFRKVSWAEALDYTAEKLKTIKDEYGPEGVAFFGHTSGDFWFTDYLPQAWGSPNAAKPSMSLCTSPREEAALLTFGRSIGNHEPVDWDAARCIVLIGTHIGEDSRNTMMQDFANARGRGARVIVVDPRFSSAGMKADTWLPIKPGTDIALLLAWMNVLIGEGLYDRDFVARWTVGFDQLAAHVKEFTPEWAAPITDLPADQIRAAARAFGEARPQAVIVPGRHVTWYGDDSQRMRAVYILNALVGALGRPGGLYFNKPPFVDEHSHPPYAVTGGAGG